VFTLFLSLKEWVLKPVSHVPQLSIMVNYIPYATLSGRYYTLQYTSQIYSILETTDLSIHCSPSRHDLHELLTWLHWLYIKEHCYTTSRFNSIDSWKHTIIAFPFLVYCHYLAVKQRSNMLDSYTIKAKSGGESLSPDSGAWPMYIIIVLHDHGTSKNCSAAIFK